MEFDIALTTRPIKIATVIREGSPTEALKAIETLSSIWGGMTGCIIETAGHHDEQNLLYFKKMLTLYKPDYLAFHDEELLGAFEHVGFPRSCLVDDPFRLPKVSSSILLRHAASNLIETVEDSHQPVRYTSVQACTNENDLTSAVALGYVDPCYINLLQQQCPIPIGSYTFGSEAESVDGNPVSLLYTCMNGIECVTDPNSNIPLIVPVKKDNLRDLIAFWNLRALEPSVILSLRDNVEEDDADNAFTIEQRVRTNLPYRKGLGGRSFAQACALHNAGNTNFSV